jgi:hypothetical protein
MSRIFDQLRRAEQERAAQTFGRPPNEDVMGSPAKRGKSYRQPQGPNRSARFPVLIPVKVKGKDTEGRIFEEDSRTIVVTRHAILVAMTHQLALGAEIVIENLALGRTSVGRVVSCNGEASMGANEIGVCLTDVEDICGIKLPSEHDQP